MFLEPKDVLLAFASVVFVTVWSIDTSSELRKANQTERQLWKQQFRVLLAHIRNKFHLAFLLYLLITPNLSTVHSSIIFHTRRLHARHQPGTADRQTHKHEKTLTVELLQAAANPHRIPDGPVWQYNISTSVWNQNLPENLPDVTH